MNEDRNVEVVMTIDSLEAFREFVQSTSEQYHTLTRQAPDLKWAKSIKRLMMQISEVLVTASPLLQETAHFAELRCVHGRLLRLISQNIAMIDSEGCSVNRFY